MDREIKAVFIDVDGCLLPTNGDVSFEYYLGLTKLSEYVKKSNQGIFPTIGFCSGRDRNYIEAVAFFTGLPNSWSVIESGIAIFNPTTKELIFNPDLTPEVRKAFEEISQERIPRILKKYKGLFRYPGNMICEALERRYGSNLTIEECYEAVKQDLADLLKEGLVTITHSEIAVDISPSEIDKASGIRFLSQHTEIDLGQALGIGDSKGDFPLFQEVEYVGCPDNASKDCKKFVEAQKGYISFLSYAMGVVDVIAHFIKRKRG